MDELVKKIVNLGIGAGKVVETNAQKIMSDIGSQLNTLIEKGESADDQVSKKIKVFVEEAATNITQVVENSTANTNEVFSKVKKTSEDLIQNLKGLIGKNSE